MSDLWLIEKDKIISELITRSEKLEKHVVYLEKENSELRERLSKYENPKNSRNSSIAPSKDENRPKKNQSLRKSTGKKIGGQPGHKGRTLEINSTPDRIIDISPEYCNNCGSSLEKAIAVQEKSRQTVDIPPIKAVWTQYNTYSKKCNCGYCSASSFPQGVTSPVSYGSNIEALIGYFHARQYLPFARMKEMMNDVFNINISEGGLHYLLNRFADKSTPMYEEIKERVSKAKVVGTDETGVKVNGDKHWYWVWQTTKLTYIAHSNTRGKMAIDINFPQGFPNATLVRDGWRAQIATLAKNHQTCLPHMLRHLIYLNEKYKTTQWGEKLQKLYLDAIELSKKHEINEANFERNKIVLGLEELLEKPPDKKHNELYTFYKRTCRERQSLFTFLFVKDVPSDNNASERAIRNVKVKQKISGQFKTELAAENFAKIRSVIDTTIKNGMNVLESLILIAKLKHINGN